MLARAVVHELIVHLLLKIVVHGNGGLRRLNLLIRSDGLRLVADGGGLGHRLHVALFVPVEEFLSLLFALARLLFFSLFFGLDFLLCLVLFLTGFLDVFHRGFALVYRFENRGVLLDSEAFRQEHVEPGRLVNVALNVDEAWLLLIGVALVV